MSQMDNEHNPFLENVPAYALGALDPEEASALEAHLETCQMCSDELASYAGIGDGMLLAPPQLPPSAGLRRRLQQQLPSRQTPGKRPALNPLAWALGAGVVLLLVLNLYAISQLRAIQSRQGEVSQQLGAAQAALAVLAYPGTENVSIEAGGVVGRLLLDTEQNAAALVLWDAPRLPEDQTYQMWLISPNGERTSAGLFRPQSALTFATIWLAPGQDLSSFSGLGVTVEPAAGSAEPTGPRLFQADY